jgi:Fic-DOC domain mobile mystery protein B
MDDAAAWDAAAADGATPLDPDEAEGLKPTWITTRDDLNEAEQANIATALSRSVWDRYSTRGLLDDLHLRELHRAMFEDVWTWAGTYRTREKNIGVAPHVISTEVRALCENAKYWFDGDDPMHPDEAGARFHHQLVKVHPFPNGNGRLARAITDLLMSSCGEQRFTWGSVNLDSPSEVRSRYIAALRAADAGDYGPLLEFVRS